MSRIPLITKEEAQGDVAAVFGALEENFKKVPNLFATVAHLPQAMGPLLSLFDTLYNQSDLAPRLLEMVVIKVSYGYQSHYCLTLHKAFALERGLTNADILAMEAPGGPTGFPENERVLLEYVDQYVREPLEVSDDLFARLSEHFTPGQIVNLSLLASLSGLFGQMANALKIPVDAFIGTPAPGND